MTSAIVVTGASSGIGAAVASRVLQAGNHVIGVCRTAPAQGVEHLRLDLAQATAADIRHALAGRKIQAFIHAAGFLRVGMAGAMNAVDGVGMWRLHVECACAFADALVPGMTDGGRIVLIGSRTAAGAAGRSQYAASKAALVGLARSWAAELAPRGITVNVVAPGATQTPMLEDPARGGVPPRLPPIGRFIQPSEVAATVMFLLGEEAAAITGQQIVICGGSSL